jgi:phospholipid/cholesterol/gamma-HCH transport system substrate-binding protein
MRRSTEVSVGALILAALAVLAVGVVLVGQESNVFRLKNRYVIRFEAVGGLSTGNPVQLDGVAVGSVERVHLSEDPGQKDIEVVVSIDRRYAERIRTDSLARIRTLGLLGDKFVEITSGTPGGAKLEDGEQIPAAPATSVDELLASGEDVMANVTAITFSLRNILERMDRGEGLLGQLTTESETQEKMTDALLSTLGSVKQLVTRLETGEGALPRLLNDRQLADRLSGAVERMESVMTRLESGPGLLPSMLNDAQSKERFDAILARLESTTTHLEAFSREMAEGQGLLPRLLADEEYGKEVSEDLKQLLENFRGLSQQLTQGEGTAARLLNDPEIYQALDDILIGIDESWMLRWLIRNRQKAGIEKRYQDERGEPRRERPGTAGEEPPAAKPPAPAPPPVEEPPALDGETRYRGRS